MKIAFFTDTFLPEINSISVSIASLSKGLLDRGHEISIFAPIINESSGAKELFQIDGLDLIKIYRYKDALLRPEFQRNNSQIIHKDFHEILTSKPDLIHVHTPFSIGKQGVRAAHLLKVPLIGSHHSFYVNYEHGQFKKNSFLSELLMRRHSVRFYNNCQLVITPTKAIAENLRSNKLTSSLSIIPNPIDIEKLKPSASKEELKKRCGLPAQTGLPAQAGLPEFSIVYFGNITYEKRINELIKVFALLSPKYPKLRLSIIGDGPEKKNIESFAKQLNVREKVLFLGMLKGQNFVDAISANDVFVTASDTENQPLPIFEAMALGLPQIAAKSPVAEYIENGVTGFVTEKYSFMELSEKLAKLIENPSLREKMSENSKKAALKYDIKNIATEYEGIYKDFCIK